MQYLLQDISNNQLTNLPPEIGYLTKVSRLNVSNNKFQSLPPELGCMDGELLFSIYMPICLDTCSLKQSVV